jgi:hypothetical protein
VNKGVPTDDRKLDEYLGNLAKSKELIVQWLEDFRSKFEEYELAKPTIDEVESALQLYRDKIDAG